jgi:4-amino-4-deoxychorismate lyase
MVAPELPNTLINGERCETLAVSDRGLAYGHGVFETIRVSNGHPVLWKQHMERLQQGCAKLGITVPEQLSTLLMNDLSQLCCDVVDAVIKVIITAGTGGRGYAPPKITDSQRLVTLFPLPSYPVERSEQGVQVITCDYRLPHNARLAGIKHLNRLDQVLARSEWQDSEIAEGIVLDIENNVIEGTMSNVFAVIDGILTTPILTQAGVKGVMRDFILESALSMGIQSREVVLSVADFKNAAEVFVCNSVIGLWPIKQWDQQHYSKGVITDSLQQRVAHLFSQDIGTQS